MFKMSDIKKFLDGFASISAHVNVIDGPNPSSKVKGESCAVMPADSRSSGRLLAGSAGLRGGRDDVFPPGRRT